MSQDELYQDSRLRRCIMPEDSAAFLDESRVRVGCQHLAAGSQVGCELWGREVFFGKKPASLFHPHKLDVKQACRKPVLNK